jgi:LuxR family transcriptional regulator, maltose regulon positive regulatory protein
LPGARASDGTSIDPSAKTAVRVLPSRLTLRIPRAGIVQRHELVDRLCRASDRSMVAIVGSAGYGKTTLLAQWSERDPRTFASLALDESFNDPAVLLTYLTFALAPTIEVGPEVFECLIAPHPAERAEVLAALAHSLSRSPAAVVVALDDVHLLTNDEGITAIRTLAQHLPDGSQLAIAARWEPQLGLARMRAEGELFELGPPDLRFNEAEARELLAATGVDPPGMELGELLRRTDGWPVALYLAGLGNDPAALPEMRPDTFTGDDRLLVDYIRAEFVDQLPMGDRQFLTRTSVLDELSGPLCDATLARSGSAAVLEAMEASNLLLLPLDRHRQRYRYVQVFREVLRHELDRTEPGTARTLLRQASDWCAENGLLDDAVGYAQLAEDPERVSDIVIRHGMRQYALGRASAVRSWLDWLTERDSLNGGVAVIGAWLNLVSGHAAEADRLAMIAQQAPPDLTLPDGSPLEAWVQTLRAVTAVDIAHMRTDAQGALQLLAPGSQLRPTAALMLGFAELLQGDLDAADIQLADAAELGEQLRGPAALALALAVRGLIAIRHVRWDQAEALLQRSSSVIREARLRGYTSSGLTYAITARVAMHRGDARTARENVKAAEQLLPILTRALDHLAVQTRLELTRAHVALGDLQTAVERLTEIDELMRGGHEIGSLRDEYDELTTRIAEIQTSAPNPIGLTPAELRLLPHLATQLSFREIAEQLYVSVHTVKAQVTSIYRKLSVSSRTQAIERARMLGLRPD